jgi:hypothetical protein
MKVKMLHILYADKSNSVPDISATLSIPKSIFYWYVEADKADKR